MSHPAPSTEHETEGVNYGKVIGVGVASLVLFAFAIWWSAIILHRETAEIEGKVGKSKPVDVHQQEIGIVDQVPFTVDHRLGIWQHERATYLAHYGWLDRGKRTVHLPIQQAMDQLLAGAWPAGAPK